MKPGENKHENLLNQVTPRSNEDRLDLHSLLSCLPGMVFRCQNDPDWSMLYVSDGCFDVTGYDPEDLIGNKKVSYANLIHPDDRERVWEEIQQALEEDRPYQLKYRIRTATGTEKWLWEQGRAVQFPGDRFLTLQGYIADISEQRRAERALFESENQLRTMFESAAIGIALVDLDGQVFKCNAAFEKMLGYSQREIQNIPFREFTHPEDLPSNLELFSELASGKRDSYQLEKRYLRHDQTPLWAYVTTSLVRADTGEPQFVVGMVEDISLRKNLEEQFLQAQKMEVMGRLASSVAHDFNNFLAGIGGYAHLLSLKVEPGSDLSHEVTEIQTLSERAAELTRRLLTLSRKQETQSQIISLNQLIEANVKLLRHLVPNRIKLTFQSSEELWHVDVDPGQMEQVLMNLVVNAGDATPPGGQISIVTKNVLLDHAYTDGHFQVEPGEYVMLGVSDSGCGIDPKTRKRIFEPFFTTKENGRGTGLGLSTVYAIVKQHSGQIWVYSEPGNGTTFKIYLPRVVEKIPRAQSEELPGVIPEGSEGVLVVEDQDAVRDLICRILEGLGYQVFPSPDAETAEQIMQSSGCRIRLLLSDLILPGLSGRELAQRLSQDWPSLKVLYMSGYSQGVMGGDDLGEVSFLQKPFRPSDLAREVRRLLDT